MLHVYQKQWIFIMYYNYASREEIIDAYDVLEIYARQYYLNIEN